MIVFLLEHATNKNSEFHVGEELLPNATTSDDAAFPYASPLMESPVAAEIFESAPQGTPPPRIWSALVVGIMSVPVGICLQLLTLLALIFIGFGVPTLDNLPAIQDWVVSFIDTDPALAVLIVPGQGVLLAAAYLAAKFSPRPFSERLALRSGRQPIWTWPVFAVATPVIGIVSSSLLSLVMDESENMKSMQKYFLTKDSSFMPTVFLMVAVLPGFCEEVLFRGYVQSRLLKRLPAAAAIAISTLLFSAAHLDPKHVLAVIPLGAWLGIVAWRTGTIWPSIFGHMLNNALAVWITRQSGGDEMDVEFSAQLLGVYALCGAALIVAIYALVRFGGEPTPAVSVLVTPTASPSDAAKSTAGSNNS